MSRDTKNIEKRPNILYKRRFLNIQILWCWIAHQHCQLTALLYTCTLETIMPLLMLLSVMNVAISIEYKNELSVISLV